MEVDGVAVAVPGLLLVERADEEAVGAFPIGISSEVESLFPGLVAIVESFLFCVGPNATANNHPPLDLRVPEQCH